MTTPDLVTGNTWNLEIADDGSFVRRATGFRNLISRERGAAHPPEAGRYHLYVSLACPWRTVPLSCVHSKDCRT